MEPLFHQSWFVFAPDPIVSQSELWIRCQVQENQWSDWRDPGSIILEKHRKQRLSYYGQLYSIYEGLIRNLHNVRVGLKNNEYCKDKIGSLCDDWLEHEIVQTPEYLVMKRFTQDLCHAEIKNFSGNSQFRIAIWNFTDFSQRKHIPKKEERDMLIVDYP